MLGTLDEEMASIDELEALVASKHTSFRNSIRGIAREGTPEDLDSDETMEVEEMMDGGGADDLLLTTQVIAPNADESDVLAASTRPQAPDKSRSEVARDQARQEARQTRERFLLAEDQVRKNTLERDERTKQKRIRQKAAAEIVAAETGAAAADAVRKRAESALSAIGPSRPGKTPRGRPAAVAQPEPPKGAPPSIAQRMLKQHGARTPR